MTDTRQWAERYIDEGWSPIPIPKGEKGPRVSGWEQTTFAPSDFSEDDNVGVHLGKTGLYDVDLDDKMAIVAADMLLPNTGRVSGRPSKPRSHLFFTSEEEIQHVAYHGLEGNNDTIVELRGYSKNGAPTQTVVPPSVHPSGEVIAWDTDQKPFHCALPEQTTAWKNGVRNIAIAVLLARAFPGPGHRHAPRLALAGFLCRAGLSEREILDIGRVVMRLIQGDESDWLTVARTTIAKFKSDPDAHVTGAPTLRSALTNGEAVVKRLREWLQVDPFIRGKNGLPLRDSQHNIRVALEELDVTLRYNDFQQKPLVIWPLYGNYEGPLDDAIRDRIWLTVDETFRFRPSAEFFDTVVQDLARQQRFHPVLDYLDGLQWDGTSRIDTWLSTYGHADETVYTCAVSRIFLIAAVRRARHPGCKYDELLTLLSDQGFLKSTALRALCPNNDWFSDDLPLNVESKQVIERTGGKWLIEASDLQGYGKRDVEHLKAFLSRQVDGPVRLAYARLAVERPRQFILAGTTNTAHFLKDKTGHRRFWPVVVRRFDIPKLIKDRDQLWAEAAHYEATGESIRLDPKLYQEAARRQEAHQLEDEWMRVLRTGLGHDEGDTPKDRLLINEPWDILGMPLDRRDDRAAERVAAIMQALGYEKRQARGLKGDVKSTKRWVLKQPPDLLDA